MLAGRSYASSDNLYDNISLVQVPEFAHAGLIVSLSAFIFLFLIRKKPSPSN